MAEGSNDGVKQAKEKPSLSRISSRGSSFNKPKPPPKPVGIISAYKGTRPVTRGESFNSSAKSYDDVDNAVRIPNIRLTADFNSHGESCVMVEGPSQTKVDTDRAPTAKLSSSSFRHEGDRNQKAGLDNRHETTKIGLARSESGAASLQQKNVPKASNSESGITNLFPLKEASAVSKAGNVAKLQTHTDAKKSLSEATSAPTKNFPTTSGEHSHAEQLYAGMTSAAIPVKVIHVPKPSIASLSQSIFAAKKPDDIELSRHEFQVTSQLLEAEKKKLELLLRELAPLETRVNFGPRLREAEAHEMDAMKVRLSQLKVHHDQLNMEYDQSARDILRASVQRTQVPVPVSRFGT